MAPNRGETFDNADKPVHLDLELEVFAGYPKAPRGYTEELETILLQ